jgi:hypothetical protein
MHNSMRRGQLRQWQPHNKSSESPLSAYFLYRVADHAIETRA